MGSSYILLFFLMIVTAATSDEEPLQDFCVRDVESSVTVNGFPCKSADKVVPQDFKSSILSKAGNTSNALKSKVTPANAAAFPGLNTLGVSFARLDLAPGGLNPPHVHPRATELLYLVSGTITVGFVTTGDNKLYAQTLNAGDLFVFPRGLVHFQLNLGKEPAVGVAGFNSQTPGTSQVAKAVFASSPELDDAVLEKAFQISGGLVKKLRASIKAT